jgi:hypothetical protein
MPGDDGSHLSRRLHWDAEREAAGKPRVDADGWDEHVDWSADAAAAEAGRFADAEAPPRSFERRDLDRIDADALDRRRQLWRDTALILSGLVVALLVANLVLPGIAGLAGPSPSPGPSGLLAAPSPSAQGATGATQQPILDPGLGIATPTPIPVITLPPTGTSAPSTPRPISTPRPTRAPTPPPPTKAPPTPQPTPEVTPIPPPGVHVSCTALPAMTVSCSVVVTDVVAGSETWDMGGQGAIVTGGDGSDSITFLYDAEGTYHVVVSVTGLDGSTTSDGTDVSVSAT